MAHSLKLVDDGIVLLEYSGLVGYAERTEAVVNASKRLKTTGATALVVDFTHAVVVEEDEAHRADFIASAIVAWSVEEARVAFVGIPHPLAWPAELACEIRHIPARVFSDRSEALEWLHVPQPPNEFAGLFAPNAMGMNAPRR